MVLNIIIKKGDRPRFLRFFLGGKDLHSKRLGKVLGAIKPSIELVTSRYNLPPTGNGRIFFGPLKNIVYLSTH